MSGIITNGSIQFMRSMDKYVNFIKMYSTANQADRKELEKSIIIEGDIVSFGILNYAYFLNDKSRRTNSVTKVQDYIDEEYINLLVSGFKFFQIQNVDEWFELASNAQINKRPNKIYNHLLEYKIIDKFPENAVSSKITNYKNNPTLDEIILTSQVVIKQYDEIHTTSFNKIELNLNPHDLALIYSKDKAIQNQIIESFVLSYARDYYKREGLLNFLYLIDYYSNENLEMITNVLISNEVKKDLIVKRYVEVLLKSPTVSNEKKYTLIKGFFRGNGLKAEIIDEIEDSQNNMTLDEDSEFDDLSLHTSHSVNLSQEEWRKNRVDYEDGKISKEQYTDFLESFEKTLHDSILVPKKEGLAPVHTWFKSEDLQKLNPKDKEEKELMGRIIENAFKPKIDLTDDKIEQIEELKKELPNFSDVIDYIVSQIKLNLMHNGKMSFKPVLLLGDPGLGKTYVAKEVARIMDTGFEFIDFASTSAAFIIKGGSKQWKDAEEGKILKLMITSNTINPIALYDEIDKNTMSKNYPPEVVLYQLFEPMNARNFEDEYMGVKFDASTIINICTANSIDTLTAPLLSRMDVFTIEKLNTTQTRYLINKMYEKIISNYNIFEKKLSEDIIKSLENMTPREIDTSIHKIIAKNIEKMSLKDINKYNPQHRLDLKAIDFNHVKKDKKIGF